MRTENSTLEMSYQDFVTSRLPLFSGPQVKVRIGSASREYELSKAILCEQSPYFAATFEGEFREGQDQSTTLAEVDGIVSPRSFEMLVQWLYLGRVGLSEPEPEESITAAIEFVRLADMCEVIGMETQMADHIRDILLDNPAPKSSQFHHRRDPDTNTYILTSQHITSAALLPNNHPVRRMLASASVEGYIRRSKHKFLKEILEVPNFAADLLMEVKETLKTVDQGGSNSHFRDPFSGERLLFLNQ